MSVSLVINGLYVPFKKWNFPGGEVGVKLPVLPERLGVVKVKVHGVPSSEDIFVAMNVLDALHNLNVDRNKVILYFNYLPYARQDRVCNEGESFALQVFIRMIMSMQHTFSQVQMEDVHSQVALEEMIDHSSTNVRIVNYSQEFFTENLPEFDVIIAPDRGAFNKATNTQPRAFHVFLNKFRQGSEVIYEDYAYDTLVGRACIVDDICDGGATFLSAAKMLRRTQPRLTELSLYVTHGIFSKGIDVVREQFNNVYVSNPMTDEAYKALLVDR